MKEEITTKNVSKTRGRETILSLIRKGENVVPSNNVEQENIEFANLVITAEKFVENYRKENGTKSYISERLRDGYIGELINLGNGNTYIRSIRGRPYGTVVAIPTNDGVSIGTSYVDKEDKNVGHPIIGLYLALQRAINNKAEKHVKSHAKKQVEHFKKRALAFFHPDVYSYSRGTNPVVYEDFDAIHERRAKILGK